MLLADLWLTVKAAVVEVVEAVKIVLPRFQAGAGLQIEPAQGVFVVGELRFTLKSNYKRSLLLDDCNHMPHVTFCAILCDFLRSRCVALQLLTISSKAGA